MTVKSKGKLWANSLGNKMYDVYIILFITLSSIFMNYFNMLALNFHFKQLINRLSIYTKSVFIYI